MLPGSVTAVGQKGKARLAAVSAQANGPPATMPAPTMSFEWATSICTAIKAPDESPETEVAASSVPSLGSASVASDSTASRGRAGPERPAKNAAAAPTKARFASKSSPS